MEDSIQHPQNPLNANSAPVMTEISEIFSSIQGEGPYLGKKQIFVRFGRCNMHCHYCDELDKMQKGMYQTLPVSSVLAQIDDLEREQGSHHSVSLTGGEPLVYPRALEAILPELKARGLRTYLETNGTLPRVLERVIGQIDIVAMDLKPSSSTGDRAFWSEHRSFLAVARRSEVFVKTVITSAVTTDDIRRAVEIVADVDPRIPFIFQPQSLMTGISVDAMKLIENELFTIASASLKDVRVIPQMHKIWGMR
jgi:7-carboxy-7-deazaguanine synthase